MTRPPRLDIPGMPQHLVVRGNNRGACFIDELDRHVYLRYAQEYAVAYACEIHSYVLMTNHVHLLVTGREPGAISRFIQVLNRRYARFFNRSHDRTGTLYEGRFRSCVIESDANFFAVMRYHDLNPVRAGMVASPGQYRWSSFRANASGNPRGLLTPHPLYLQLGADAASRGRAYLRLFETEQSVEVLDIIRNSLR